MKKQQTLCCLLLLTASFATAQIENRLSLDLIYRTHYFSANTGSLNAASGFAVGTNYELGINYDLSERVTITLEMSFQNNKNMRLNEVYALDEQTGNLMSNQSLAAGLLDSPRFDRLHMRCNRYGLGALFALLPQKEDTRLGILLGYSLGLSLVAWHGEESKISPISPSGVFVYEVNDHRKGVVHRLNNNMLLLDSQVELAFQLPKSEWFPFKLIHSIAAYADITHTNVLRESFTLMPITAGIKTRFKIFRL